MSINIEKLTHFPCAKNIYIFNGPELLTGGPERQFSDFFIFKFRPGLKREGLNDKGLNDMAPCSVLAASLREYIFFMAVILQLTFAAIQFFFNFVHFFIIYNMNLLLFL